MASSEASGPSSDEGMGSVDWLAPERWVVCLLCFLTFIGACITGLLLAAG